MTRDSGLCRAPVGFNVRRADRTGDYYFVCQRHVPWGQAQFPDSRVLVRAIRAGEVTSGCVAPKGIVGSAPGATP